MSREKRGMKEEGVETRSSKRKVTEKTENTVEIDLTNEVEGKLTKIERPDKWMEYHHFHNIGLGEDFSVAYNFSTWYDARLRMQLTRIEKVIDTFDTYPYVSTIPIMRDNTIEDTRETLISGAASAEICFHERPKRYEFDEELPHVRRTYRQLTASLDDKLKALEEKIKEFRVRVSKFYTSEGLFTGRERKVLLYVAKGDPPAYSGLMQAGIDEKVIRPIFVNAISGTWDLVVELAHFLHRQLNEEYFPVKKRKQFLKLSKEYCSDYLREACGLNFFSGKDVLNEEI